MNAHSVGNISALELLLVVQKHFSTQTNVIPLLALAQDIMVVPADACVRIRDKFALIITEESGNNHKRDCFSQLFNLRTKSGEHNILCRWTDHTLNGDAVCVCMLNKRIISLCNRWFSVYTIHFFLAYDALYISFCFVYCLLSFTNRDRELFHFVTVLCKNVYTQLSVETHKAISQTATWYVMVTETTVGCV